MAEVGRRWSAAAKDMAAVVGDRLGAGGDWSAWVGVGKEMARWGNGERFGARRGLFSYGRTTGFGPGAHEGGSTTLVSSRHARPLALSWARARPAMGSNREALGPNKRPHDSQPGWLHSS